MRLACSGLNFAYPASDVLVIENLHFTLRGPGFHAVFGPSGVGKTSLARLLTSRRDHPELPISVSDIETILYCYNRERMPRWSTVGTLLDRACPRDHQQLKAELIPVFHLGPVMDSRFSQLSMGQQNRINLLRYLLQEFDLLIMDESLANVDEKRRQEILLSIKERFSHKMFLYISHNLMEVARFCRDILVLSEPSRKRPGRVVGGQDDTRGMNLSAPSLDRIMLEIMNAF